jgi:hypothetical protein
VNTSVIMQTQKKDTRQHQGTESVHDDCETKKKRSFDRPHFVLPSSERERETKTKVKTNTPHTCTNKNTKNKTNYNTKAKTQGQDQAPYLLQRQGTGPGKKKRKHDVSELRRKDYYYSAMYDCQSYLVIVLSYDCLVV